VNRPLRYTTFLLLLTLVVGCKGFERVVNHSGGKQQASLATAMLTVAPPATPSEPPIDNPQATSNQEATLLPTVTPTPPPTATPVEPPPVTQFSTLLSTEDPTAEPELHPIATPYYYASQALGLRGITYTERSNAGFGLFPANTISPCLCRFSQDASACSQEIEQYQLSIHPTGVVSTEQCTSIDLSDGRSTAFNPVTSTTGVGSVNYIYQKWLSEINYHLVLAGYWEGWDYLLVDSNSGKATVIQGEPVISPDNRHFALTVPLASFVQVWSLADDGPQYKKGWQIEGLPWQSELVRPVITWTSPNRFEVEWPIPSGVVNPPSAPESVTVALEEEGWVVYHDDKPMTPLIVDAASIHFANGGIDDMLDTLAVGNPVYIDHDYVFTAIPTELDGAVYFRIPQSYFLGEDPSYFPLKAQMANYLDFNVTDDAIVYVALDAIIDDMPDWMQEGWQPAGITLETNDIPLKLYRKEYPAGTTVGLVDRWMTEGRVPSQFVVMVTHAPK
jgi:hypothetical protein